MEANLQHKKRPVLLTVLCILTFIGAGFLLLGSIVNASGAFSESRQVEIEKSKKIMEAINPKVADELINAVEIQRKEIFPKWLEQLIESIFSLVGAFLMWRLNKLGFWIYTAAELIPFYLWLFIGGGANEFNSAMTMASYFGGFAHAMTLFVVILIPIFDLTFIFLYSRNLKFMN